MENLEALLEKWFETYIRNTVLSRSEEAWNAIQKAVAELKAEL